MKVKFLIDDFFFSCYHNYIRSELRNNIKQGLFFLLGFPNLFLSLTVLPHDIFNHFFPAGTLPLKTVSSHSQAQSKANIRKRMAENK